MLGAIQVLGFFIILMSNTMDITYRDGTES